MITQSGKAIQFKRAFWTDVETLFEAWKNPTTLQQWWTELTKVEIDFRPGGQYKHICGSESDGCTVGEYKEIIPNQKITLTWNDILSDRKVKHGSVTLNFSKLEPGLSQLELIHEGLESDAAIDDFHFGWTANLLNLDKYLNGSHRQVREDLKAEVSRTMPFSVEEVYEAWTKPELVTKWFNSKNATLGKAKLTLKVGHGFFMDYQTSPGTLLRIYGEYLEIVPHKKLVFTWLEDNHGNIATPDRQYETRVTVHLTDLGGKTKVDVIHDCLASNTLMGDFTEGWTDCLKSIENELKDKVNS